MMKKIRMNCTATLDETFADFLLSRRAKGLAAIDRMIQHAARAPSSSNSIGTAGRECPSC